jgi:hypothetical protein
LYGCETWSLALREENRLMVSEKRVLRRIFEPKREIVIGENCRMRSYINCLFFQNIIRMIKSRTMR